MCVCVRARATVAVYVQELNGKTVKMFAKQETFLMELMEHKKLPASSAQSTFVEVFSVYVCFSLRVSFFVCVYMFAR